MKIITEPNVHLLAAPQFFPHPEYEIPPTECDAEAIIAHAGKGCYDSYGADGRPIDEHIKSLIYSLHGSVLEHVNFTLFITGISRGLSHELVRHRAGFAYSQRSTRYTKEEDAAIVLSPYMADIYTRWNTQFNLVSGAEEGLITDFLEDCTTALRGYARCVSRLLAISEEEIEQKALGFTKGSHDHRKWARGQARQLLPHALETRMTVTANIRAWRFFFEQRSSKWAEDEIRRLAYHVFECIAGVAGTTLADFDYNMVRGIPAFSTEYKKV